MTRACLKRGRDIWFSPDIIGRSQEASTKSRIENIQKVSPGEAPVWLCRIPYPAKEQEHPNCSSPRTGVAPTLAERGSSFVLAHLQMEGGLSWSRPMQPASEQHGLGKNKVLGGIKIPATGLRQRKDCRTNDPASSSGDPRSIHATQGQAVQEAQTVQPPAWREQPGSHFRRRQQHFWMCALSRSYDYSF